MIPKIVIIVLLLAMLTSLAIGLYHLLKTPDERDKGNKVATALTWRIGIWVVLLVFILISMQLGWIKPSNSVNPHNLKKEHQERLQ